MTLLPAGTSAWIVHDGKAGLETHCTGLAEALGLKAERRLVSPRRFWSALMPYGPVDPLEQPHKAGSPIAPPYPDILISSGRRALPYVREVKRQSDGKTFTIFLQDPVIGAKAADLICVPWHDKLRGANVVPTLTTPHSLTAARLAAARAAPDPRLARLKGQTLALVLGGKSQHHDLVEQDARKLADIALRHATQDGLSLIVTPSRRTPAPVLAAISAALYAAGLGEDRHFVWDFSGENPYVAMLALAGKIIVTGDSVNMVSEACATGRPVYVYLPSGKGHTKITRFHSELFKAGVARLYEGSVAGFSYEPVDATPLLAREVVARYAAFQRRSLTGG